VTHMPIKFARRVDVGSAKLSAYVDLRQSPKTDALVLKISYCFSKVLRLYN